MEKIRVVGTGIDGISKQDLLNGLINSFGQELLKTLSISKIKTNNKVFCVLDGFDNPGLKAFSIQQFKDFLATIANQRLLLENVCAGVNNGRSITLFNQDYVSELYDYMHGISLQDAGLGYLYGIDNSLIPNVYKLGTMYHEVGHTFYFQLINLSNAKKKRKSLVDESGPLTIYVKDCFDKGSDIYYEENFAEAMRIYYSNPLYLINHYPNYYEFLNKYLLKHGANASF